MATYCSPKVEVRDQSTAGKGVFAKGKIYKGEMVFDFTDGVGQYVSTQEMDELFDKGQDYGLQVDDNLFFAATNDSEMEAGDYLNHSCDANLGIKDKFKMVAMRDIEPGEEVAFDYAMSESSDFKMKCKCGSENCRRVITGEDWKRKDLQEKYKDYFSDYLTAKINSK